MILNKQTYQDTLIVLAKLQNALRTEVITLPLKINKKEKFLEHINTVAYNHSVLIIVTNIEDYGPDSIKLTFMSASEIKVVTKIFHINIDGRKYRSGVNKLCEIFTFLMGHHFLIRLSKNPKSGLVYKTGFRYKNNLNFDMVKKVLEEAYK